MTSFELFVALRYLRARRKQAVLSVVTLISIVGVTAGVAALVIALSLNSGFQGEFQSRILGVTSHVNLFRSGTGALRDYRQLAEVTRRAAGVTSVVPSVYGQCLLQSDLRQQAAVLKGIEMKTADAQPALLPRIIEGSLEEFDRRDAQPSIVLGKDLAGALGVFVGESLRAVGLGGELSPLGRMPRVQSFRVVAIFESGLWEYDSNWALISVSAAQSFTGLPNDEVSALEFRISEIYRAAEAASEIRRLAGAGYATNTWIDLNRPLFSALRLEKLALFVAISLIVLVASLNIVSTLTLMVMEKHRDIAIITAMGGTARTIATVFVLQGLVIGLLGTVLGNLFGGVAVWYFDRFKVFHLEPQVYAIPYVPFRWQAGDVMLVSVVALLISVVATVYPARAAARLDPVEAIRYE